MRQNLSAKPWTDAEKAQVAHFAALGMSGGDIASRFEGRTRSSVCGLVKRMGVKLLGQNGGNTSRKGKKRAPRKPSNVIPFPKQAGVMAVSKAPPPKAVKLSVVSSNVELMVADWLAKNGGPRRIERGVSRDWIEGFLRKHGYAFDIWKCKPRLGGRVVTWCTVNDLVDRIRAGEGLQPFKVRSA
jgi:hypothetical protein